MNIKYSKYSNKNSFPFVNYIPSEIYDILIVILWDGESHFKGGLNSDLLCFINWEVSNTGIKYLFIS